MTSFQTRSQGRLRVHVLSTRQFRTRHVSIRLSRPITRESVTATALLPYLWMEGTRQHPTAQALIRRADDLFGAVLRTGISKRGDRHVAEVALSVPDETGVGGLSGLFRDAWTLALSVMADPMLDGAQFPTAHVQRERALHKRRIESIFDDKIAFAMERCLQELCSDGPAGLPRLGYLEDLAELDGAQLWTHHQALLQESEIHCYVIGDVDVEETADSLFTAFEHAVGTRGEGVFHPVDPLRPRAGDVRRVTDAQPVRQGKLDLGFRTGISPRDAHYGALLVGNGVLGGFAHSKLFLNVREEASLAYYASSRLDGLTGTVAVQTGIEVDNHQQALEIILEQVKALQAGDIGVEELEFTRDGLRNQYHQVLDQPFGMADVHFTGVLAGVERDVTDLLRTVDSVTREQVVEAANAWHLDTIYFLRGQEVAARA